MGIVIMTTWDDLFLGPYDEISRKREGGLYYISERALGGHTADSKLAFALLESAAKEGTNPNKRVFEKEFLSISGKALCAFLKLNYYTTILSIELMWEKINGA